MADPRLADPPLTVNERLQDLSIRHMMYQLRAGSAEVNRIRALLERDVLPDLEEQILRLAAARPAGGRPDPRGFAALVRLRKLRARVRDVLRDGLAEVARTHRQHVLEQAMVEARWQVMRFREAAPVGVEFTMPAAETLRSVVTAKPMDGRLLRDWWRDTSVGARRVVEQAVNRGIVEGQSIDAMVQAVMGDKGAAGMIVRDVEKVVRTATSHTVNHARMASYEANQDVIKGYKWLATLDTVTCVICGGLDGQVFTLRDDGSAVRSPPAHLNCRCTTTPVLKSFQELGIDLPELDDLGTRVARPGRPGRVRTVDVGGEVPAGTTYSEWLARQPADVMDEALGPTRGRAFRAGEIKVRQFVDRGGNPLTLAELEKKFGL